MAIMVGQPRKVIVDGMELHGVRSVTHDITVNEIETVTVKLLCFDFKLEDDGTIVIRTTHRAESGNGDT